MPQTPSPLRFPGGKTSIWRMISKIVKDNGLERGHYVEPYAGGCGLALSLMFGGYVHELHLNDIDRSIFKFWEMITCHTEQFIAKIRETPITMEEWYKQRLIQKNRETAEDFGLGFSTFYLNRTNRSGIILKAGVIGGYQQQSQYKMDCRFNKDALIKKIRRIAKYKHRIHLYNLDAVDFMQKIDVELPENTFYFVDPPYYTKGHTLYTNFYRPDDHKLLADIVLGLRHPWVLTYDNSPATQRLYSTQNQFRFNVNYSAARKRVGEELLIASNGLNLEGNLDDYGCSLKKICSKNSMDV